MWDNPGRKHYYFNTADHDIQYDMVKVQERVALLAKANAENLSVKDDKLVYPDEVFLFPVTTTLLVPHLLPPERMEGTLATRRCQPYPTNLPLLALS
jgi:hypothetical protein